MPRPRFPFSLALLTALLAGPLVVPATLAVTAQPTTTAKPAAAAALTYTVQTGDTLYRIATERGLKVEDLMRLNNLATTDVEIGQVLKLPAGSVPTTQPPASSPTPQQPALVPPVPQVDAPASSPAQVSPVQVTTGNVVGGVTVQGPARLRMGDAFVLRLSGTRAGEATITFPSEVGEDVRRPAEVLTPIGAAGEYRVLGRVVLGKTTPLVYAVRVGDKVLQRSVPVSGLEQQIQHLTLPKTLTDRLKAPTRPAEEQVVEAAYALRTPQAWTRPFAPPLASASVSSSFGQPRTYVAGGPVAYHYGMDFPAKVGTPVRAVNDGRVVIAAQYPVRGGLVGIDHGAGLVSLYFHQSKVLVKVGQTVKRGDVVGQVGTTGLSTGPHLHLEMRVRGEATLPSEYFNRLWP